MNIRTLELLTQAFMIFALPEQKRRVAGGLGASNPQYKRVMGIVNMNLHWAAFLIDRPNKICYMFDPLQSDSNYALVKKSVRNVVEGILELEGKLAYERITWCTQLDGSSCEFGAS